MKKGKKLYEGKAKIIYAGPDKGTGIQHFKTYLKLKKWHNYQTTVLNIVKKKFH